MREIRADGTLSDSNGVKGLWKLTPTETVEQKYRFTFDGGVNFDDVVLSTDGKKFAGKSTVLGVKVWAERID